MAMEMASSTVVGMATATVTGTVKVTPTMMAMEIVNK
jgi:hypothetical protein